MEAFFYDLGLNVLGKTPEPSPPSQLAWFFWSLDIAIVYVKLNRDARISLTWDWESIQKAQGYVLGWVYCVTPWDPPPNSPWGALKNASLQQIVPVKESSISLRSFMVAVSHRLELMVWGAALKCDPWIWGRWGIKNGRSQVAALVHQQQDGSNYHNE